VTAASAATVTPAWSSITGTPTTVSGYGITDAVDLTTDQTVAGLKTLSNPLGLANQSTDPSAPASGSLLYAKKVAGLIATKAIGVGNRAAALQNAFWNRRVAMFLPDHALGLMIGSGNARYGNSQYNLPFSLTNPYLSQMRTGWANVVTTTNQALGFSTTVQVARSNVPGIGGFFFYCRAGFETWTNGGRMFVGPGSGAGDVTNEPGFSNNGCGFVIESGDAGAISFMTRNNYNTNTKTPTGMTAATGKGFDFYIFCEPNTSKIEWLIRDLSTGAEATGIATTNLWTNTAFIYLGAFGGNAALTTAGAISFSVAMMYNETL
jgi:hypothetical protein